MPREPAQCKRSSIKCLSFTSLGRRRNGLWLEDGDVETHKRGQEAHYAASVAEPCCSDLAHRLSRTSVDVNI